MEDLNSLELALLKDCTFDKPEKFFIPDHLPYLKIINRKYTGVGEFILFDYLPGKEILIDPKVRFTSTNEHIFDVDTIKHGIGSIFYVRDSKIVQLEVYTFADAWWGNIICLL